MALRIIVLRAFPRGRRARPHPGDPGCTVQVRRHFAGQPIRPSATRTYITRNCRKLSGVYTSLDKCIDRGKRRRGVRKTTKKEPKGEMRDARREEDTSASRETSHTLTGSLVATAFDAVRGKPSRGKSSFSHDRHDRLSKTLISLLLVYSFQFMCTLCT